MIGSLLHLPKAFLRYFRLFRGYTGNRIFLLIGLNAAMSYAEGIGIALFFPLFANGAGGGKDRLASSLASVLGFFHVAPTPLGVLPLIVLVFVAKGLLQFFAVAYQLYLHAQVSRALRRRYIVGLCAIDYRVMIGASAGHHSNVLVSEVTRFGDAFISFARTLPPAINVAIFFVIVFLLDWQLTAAAMLMGLVLVAIVQVTGKLLARYSRANVAEYSALTSLLIQMVQGFKYLRTRAGFPTFQRRIDESADRLAHAQFRTGVVNALTQAISQPIAVVLLAGVVYYRVSLLGQAMGPLFILLAYFLRMISEIWSVQVSWQGFYSNIGSVHLVQSSLEQIARDAEPMGSRPYPGLADQIALTDVDFDYISERPVLRHVNLAIPRNSTVAFVGESGSGKSTLVDIITGTLKPTGGLVTVDGLSLGEIDLQAMRARIGYVPQEAMLFDDTIANNITLWAGGSDAEIRQAAARAQCLDFIEATPDKFATRVGDRGAKLSGGQRQRIAIARELFKKPEILVLDEATSSLDSESEHAIQQSIDLIKGQVTILIIAHRLSTVRNCDRIFVLHEGAIIEAGSYSELFAKPGSRFRRMCELQRVA